MTSDSHDVFERIERERENYLEELKDFLRIASISTKPEHKDDVLRGANWVRDSLAAAGVESEIIETEGNPLVYGEWSGAPGKPTILFYGHYDVQPPEPLEEWRNPPFEPTVEGDMLVARGATDDKGQLFAHVKAVAAMLAERGSLPVNVKFLIEGEEEIGGEAIDKFVEADAGDKLACDAVVISDSSMYAQGQPSLLYGLKGLSYLQIKVTGPNHDLHSGTYGGAVMNPANALATIISRLWDADTGRVAIDGFYDDVKDLEPWEREQWAALPFDDAEYRAELGIEETFGEEGFSTLERAWGRPTLDVNGLYGGYQGEGAKTVLPGWAGAKISMRLVPNQDPEKIGRLFREHVERVKPKGVTVEVEGVHGAVPVLIETSGPIADAATGAQEDIWGKAPYKIREGGSIPVVATFAQVLEVPVLLVGLGLPDDRLHSPNEKFNLSCFYNGIKTIVRLLDRAGA